MSGRLKAHGNEPIDALIVSASDTSGVPQRPKTAAHTLPLMRPRARESNMPHITLHLDDATHAATKQAALASGLPTSHWVANLIRAQLANT